MNRWVGGLVGMAVLGVPAWTFACSLSCGDNTKISAGETGMPANTPSLFFDFDKASSVDSPITLREVGGDDVPFTIKEYYQLTPDTPFQPNTTYVVGRHVDPEENCGTPLSLTFTTGDIEPFPESLGALGVTQKKREEVRIDTSESCSDPVDVVFADFELKLPEQAHTWRGGLIIKTYVNGYPWRGSSSQGATYKPGETWMGYGKDRI